jgi:hypothetical protein
MPYLKSRIHMHLFFLMPSMLLLLPSTLPPFILCPLNMHPGVGFSASLAYEVALQLRSHGGIPVHVLALSEDPLLRHAWDLMQQPWFQCYHLVSWEEGHPTVAVLPSTLAGIPLTFPRTLASCPPSTLVRRLLHGARTSPCLTTPVVAKSSPFRGTTCRSSTSSRSAPVARRPPPGQTSSRRGPGQDPVVAGMLGPVDEEAEEGREARQVRCCFWSFFNLLSTSMLVRLPFFPPHPLTSPMPPSDSGGWSETLYSWVCVHSALHQSYSTSPGGAAPGADAASGSGTAAAGRRPLPDLDQFLLSLCAVESR